ncbi:PadR family transcriptional regulator [Qipengyuania sp. S6317L1]|uniref:PadR family transcriptional regulator n=1 Tax=Qipengyuania sp. S6317L1 TaxID=2926410 RepID=UPI001FF2B0E0|nr:PadR family transcriptional regulator [Qipengyuania sp. S6317L1]MCK0100106.1 PadR family transcriptional regulator [Qipengyuania sp. S6317L1]
MTWNGRNGGWEKLGPMIAMMAASAASDWDNNERRSRRRERGQSKDWHDNAARVRVGRKRRGRMFGTGELRLALLALIAREPRHGYELIRAIEDMTGGSYAPSPGAVYPTLQMLEEEGMIKPAKSKAKDDEDGEGSSKKPFKATKSGKAELETRADEVAELMERLGEHGERTERIREKSPDLFRAMGNLGTVLKNRARAGKLDQAAMNEIVDIIDEVAKRIERM